jgi:hypothetical protein
MNDVWDTLSDEMQVVIAHDALCRAALLLARQSELLAEEIEAVTFLIAVDPRLCA